MKNSGVVIALTVAVWALASTGALADNFGDLVLEVTNDETTNIPGTSIGSTHADFEMTFTYSHQFTDPLWGHEWERLGINYWGDTPDAYWAGDDFGLYGGYAVIIPPRQDLEWGFLLKNPEGTNIVLQSKVAQGIDSIDWSQPQEVKISAAGDRHRAWVNDNLIYDVTDGDNAGSGYITASNWIGGDTLENIDIISSVSTTFSWKNDISGDWNDGHNWTADGSGAPPDSAEETAVFGDAIQSNRAVFSESDVSVRAIVFDNTNTYAVGGPGSVSLVRSTNVGLPANSIINVANGTHQFQLNVNLQNNTTADIAIGSTLEFNNRLFLNGHTLSKTGQGTIAINNDIISGSGTVELLEGTVTGVGTIGGGINNASGTISPGVNSVQATSTVPEPATWMMLGLGLLGWLAMPRKHR